MSKPDGGPFHPTIAADRDGVMFTQEFGASLRDWFAGKAIASGHCPHNFHDLKDCAAWAYSYADAMIEARNK